MISVWMVISISHCRATRIHARSEAWARGSIPLQFAEGNAVATVAKSYRNYSEQALVKLGDMPL